MRRMRRASILIVTAMALALPGQALALVLTPPGKSGADQYFETVPTSGGNAAPPSSDPGRHAFRRLGHGVTGDARLSHLGSTGAAAAALAAATAPTPASSAATGGTNSGSTNGSGTNGGSGGGATGRNPQVTISQPSGQSSASALANALTGSDDGGLGFLLPVFLIAALVMAIGFGLLRLRQGTQPPNTPA